VQREQIDEAREVFFGKAKKGEERCFRQKVGWKKLVVRAD